MTALDPRLAGIVHELTTDIPTKVYSAGPRCRNTSCIVPLAAQLVDDPTTNTGFHYGCEEPPSAFRGTDGDVLAARAAADPPPGIDTATPTSMPAGPPPPTLPVLRDILTAHDANSARSVQTAIGPSEIGEPCQRALAYRLTGTPTSRTETIPWAPIQGTAVHAYIADALQAHNEQLGRERWIVEERVHCDDEVSGSGDAFDTDTATVLDWKVVGDSTLDWCRPNPRGRPPRPDGRMKPVYRTQAHLYGLGHQRAGRDVRWVRIVLLSRSHDYAKGTEWTEAFDPELAIRALMRMYATQDLARDLDLANNPALWAVVPAEVGDGCRFCNYHRPGGPADGTGCPGDVAAADRASARMADGLIP